ncbi:hypothetical protein [Acholeplasma palmae]|uniref:hypothetical protein n=1 Tax=Acholeplasma palmae TaxID=38986 RepID=UPI000B03C87D|nr:hypothetical protein [Alteracholeplasma palmae]
MKKMFKVVLTMALLVTTIAVGELSAQFGNGKQPEIIEHSPSIIKHSRIIIVQ